MGIRLAVPEITAQQAGGLFGPTPEQSNCRKNLFRLRMKSGVYKARKIKTRLCFNKWQIKATTVKKAELDKGSMFAAPAVSF